MSEIEGTRVETLGPAQADPADPASRGGALQRLADLVCKLMDENGPYSLSVSDAASVFADRLDSRLAADAEATSLYRTCPGKRASRVVAVVADAQAEATKANANRFSRAPGSGWGAPQGGSIGAAVLERPHGGGASWSIIKRRPTAGQKPAASIDVRDLPALIRQQWCVKSMTREQLFHPRSSLAHLAIPAATAVELLGGIAQNAEEKQGASYVWPAVDDGPGNLLIFERWNAMGGEKESAGVKLAALYGKTPRAIQQRIKPHRDANDPRRRRTQKARKQSEIGKSGSEGRELATAWTRPAAISK